METVKVVLTEGAILPVRGSSGAAGFDVFSVESGTIPPFERKLINTGLRMDIPSYLYGRVAPRSGLALSHGIDVFAGVIDQDFRGTLKIILFNSDENPFEYRVGDRIAQLIFERIAIPTLVSVDSLDDTVRNEGGFGSSGISTLKAFEKDL